jgi:enterochelin esterase-like enzyme
MNATGPEPSSGGLAIKRLEAAAPISNEVVDNFVAEHEFPLVEGPSVTFVYRGPVDRVEMKHWIFGLESSQQMTRIEGTDLFYLIVELPPKSRVEYKFEIWRGDNAEWIRDPLNPKLARDPFGANSVATAVGYEVPDWVHHDPEARPGKLEGFDFKSKALGGVRSGTMYYPARYRPNRRYPLVVVHDGSDYLNYASMGTVLDNLIHRLVIPDLVVCFIDSPNRIEDYAAHRPHAKFLCEELVPHLEQKLPLLDRARDRCLMGASFGAVASLSTAWYYPKYWGRLLLQSGSFAFTDIGRRNHRGPLFDPVVAFVNSFRNDIKAVSERLFVSCGTYESLIYENRSLVPLLDATGMQVRFTESRDGHNWENWRDRLQDGLSWLFHGPLMMVYE